MARIVSINSDELDRDIVVGEEVSVNGNTICILEEWRDYRDEIDILVKAIRGAFAEKE